MRVLVLGGYGLIGEIVVRHLIDAGHTVVGLGRRTASAKRRTPDAQWIAADLRTLTTPARWRPILKEASPDAIVNCAGALQDGARDDLSAVQSIAMQTLYVAASTAGIRSCVQISAPRARPDADTAFMRTKGEADAALITSSLDWVVLRPGLVLSSQAYGGTALIRALAAMPVIQCLTYSDRLIQTVDVNDIAKAVVMVLDHKIPTKRAYDLVEDQPHTLAEVVGLFRAWLGLPTPKVVVTLPNGILRVVAYGADMLGWLGWRSPLRSTAIAELSNGVTGDPRPWRSVAGQSLSPLHTTLRRLPSTVQERWFARCFLLKPVVIGTLAGFWLVTG